MSVRATIYIVMTDNARPGARVAVYADDGTGTIDTSTIVGSRVLFRSPSAVLDAWLQRSWLRGAWLNGVGANGWLRGAWLQHDWLRWEDLLAVSFVVPQVLVDMGGPFLFEVQAIDPGGAVPVGTTVATIDVDDANPTGQIQF